MSTLETDRAFEASVPTARTRARWRSRLGTGALHLVLISTSVIMAAPMLWTIGTSLKQPGVIFTYPPQWIPNPVDWDNYRQLFIQLPMGIFLVNSFKIATIATIGQVISCAMAAFAFARLRFPARNLLFFILLATLMVPTHVTLIPTFFIMRWLGWIDTHYSLTVPWWLGGAFGTFLLRQFFLTIPMEMMEAAKIDGAGYWRIFWRIFLPLSGPALATLAVFTFMGSWNNLLGPLIFLNSTEKMTVTLGLTLLQGQYYSNWTLLMAGAIVSVIPTMVVFFLAQKYFVEGIARVGLKG
jgi:ABC-type glycerol-3-phosphate transport system permease component